MKWFSGTIADAIQLVKERSAVFVVFIKGQDDATNKIVSFLETDRIRLQLESSNFVAIEIVSGSREHLQFSNIYRIVPIPSVFFIGVNGTPVEIATGIVASVEEMEEKILRVLKAVGKEPLLVKDETMDTDDGKQDDNQPTTSASARSANNLLQSEPVEVKETVNVAVADDVAAQSVEPEKKQTNKPLVEEKKLQQKPVSKEEEISSQREWQEKRHLKKLQDELKRERFEEQQARERIRAQIAADKIERAARSMQSNNPNGPAGGTDSSDNEAAMQQRSASPVEIIDTRLQFRFGSGYTNTKVFNKLTTIADIRAYVQRELLPGTGIKDFILVTSYPKREFTNEHNNMTLEQLGLIPTAVIMIIAKELTTTTVFANTYGNLLSTFSALLWTMINPIIATLINAKDWLTGRNTSSTTESRAQKHTSGDSGSPARKRNKLEGRGQRITSTKNENADDNAYQRYAPGSNIRRMVDQRHDSEDENATWNGNSTQQQ